MVRFLFLSDIHYDSVYCEREILKRHLDTNPDAWIVIAGDLFDAMQGKFDKRRSYEQIRPEYMGEDYYNRIVRDAVSFFKPYARRLLYVGYGNHETGALKNANIDLLQMFVHDLHRDCETPCALGGFASWLRVVFGRSDGGNRSFAKGLNIRIAHNASGGTSAPVTRGLIQTNRQAVYLANADIVLNGDNHEGYAVAITRETLLDSGETVQWVTWFLRTPGYKRAFNKQRYGFDVEKIATPKPLGGILVSVRPYCPETGVRAFEIVPQAVIE